MSARLPRWAALVDALALALIGVGLTIAATGGIRGRIAGLLFSARSPWRALAAGAILIAIRHLLIRQPSLVVRVAGTVRALPSLARRAGSGIGQAMRRGPATVGGEFALAAVLMTAITTGALWPQVTHLRATPDHGDPLFSMWRLAWVAHQLPRDPLHLYDANIFWPERASLANSDGMPLAGATAAPLVWAGVPIDVVYNLLLLGSFVVCGVAMYGLVRALGASAAGAVVAGVAFAFYPFRLEHYVHLELLGAFWMPVALWALHRVLSGHGTWRAGALLGATVGAQYLTSMYFGIFLAVYLAAAGGVMLAAWRRIHTAAWPLLIAAVVAAAAIAPTVRPYLEVRRTTGERTAWEVERFSARPADYVAIDQPDRRPNEVNERQVYPGALIVILALVALVPPAGVLRWALVAALAVMVDVSLGPFGLLQPILYEWVLPFRGLRVPARAAMLVGLSLSALAGFGAARLLARIPWAPARAVVALSFCGVLLFETRPAPPLRPVPAVHPIYEWFRGKPVSVIVEVPMWYPIGGRYLLASTTHWQRMVNGFSGSVPKSYPPLHVAMRTFPDDASLAMLRERGVRYAIVHESFYGPDDYRLVLADIERYPALELVARAHDGQFEASLFALRD